MIWSFMRRPQRSPRRTPGRKPSHVGPLECLESRLAPDASFHRVAAGALVQDWSADLITADDDWSLVPSIIGYRGDGLAGAGADPQSILADGSATPAVVFANQSDPFALPPGGLAEFSTAAGPAIALSGSDTASAPHLVLHLDTRGTSNVRLSFNLIDLNFFPSTTVQPFAVQYRIGATGDFVNVPTGFVADATNGPFIPGNLVTPVNITLPAETYDQAEVHVRILAADATGDDHWIGVDDIRVTGSVSLPQNLVFFVDPSQSALSLSGTVSQGKSTFPINPQGPGSLTTSYSGIITTSWDRGANTLGFVGPGTNLVAANSGNWEPAPGGGAGSAPANYGGETPILIVLARAAVRDLQASMSTSAPLSLAGSGGFFSFSSGQTLTLTAGNFDYNVPFLGSGRESLAGQSTPNTTPTEGAFFDLGGVYQLTVPIHVVLMETTGGFTITLTIEGTLVAYAVAPIVDLNGDAAGTEQLAGFIQGGKPVAVTPALTVNHAFVPDLTGAVISLTNRPDGTAESLVVNVGESGLSASYDPKTGVLTLSGTAPVSVYQDVLRTLTYQNTAATPNTANRLIDIVVTDGFATNLAHTAVVTVAAVRNAPVNSVPGDQFTFADTPLVFSADLGNGISVSADTGVVQVQLSVWAGTLTLASTSGLTIVSGADGSTNVTIRGTLADINAALAGLVYTPVAGFVGTDALYVITNDLTESDSTGFADPLSTVDLFLINVF